MERWQKDYIIENLSQLLENTICNTTLLTCLQSSKTVTAAEAQAINDKPEGTEKAYRLYEILQTRTDGYLSLVKSLQECGQSGAFGILMDGVVDHGFLNMKINFHSTIKSLGELLVEATETEKLRHKLKASLSQDAFLELILKHQTNENALHLVKDTIPPPLPYYVQRRLSKRNQVNPNIFKEECEDIFVFTGVNRAKLTSLVYPNPTTSSTFQLIHVSSRFIFLEQEADWKEIRNNASQPVHLIKFEQERNLYFLLDTSEATQVLRKNLQHCKNTFEGATISENEFIAANLQKHVAANICICDTPGMGKSVLLANLARKLAVASTHQQIVAFSTFSQFIDDADTPSLHFHKTGYSVIKQIVKCISPTIPAQIILSQLIKNKCLSLVLCLDGFDEIRSEQIEKTKCLLRKIIKNVQNVKVCVTARPHMQNDLETTLALISHDILPFSEADQIEFLTDYWKGVVSGTHSRDRLMEFSKLCIQNLQKVLSKQERDIMGIPLQCSLLALVYTKQAELYSSPSREPSTELQNSFMAINSVYDLYTKYFNLRFSQQSFPRKHVYSKYQFQLRAINSIIGTANNIYCALMEPRLGTFVKNEQTDCTKIVKSFHVFKALQLLFPDIPDLANDYALYSDIKDVIYNLDSFLSYGILEARNNGDGNSVSAEFVHRTFAEFLVANFFIETLTGKAFTKRKYMHFRVNVIRCFAENALSTCLSYEHHKYNQKLSRYVPVKEFQQPVVKSGQILTAFLFKHSVIIYFLNEHLARINNLTTFPDQLVLSTFFTPLNPTELYQILASCVCNGLANILRLLTQLLKHDQTHASQRMATFDLLLQEQRTVQFAHLLCLAAEYSNLNTLRECVNLFRECFHLDLSDLAGKWNILSRTPLHSAIEKADYEMVEFLVDKISLDGRSLLYYCVDSTESSSMNLTGRYKSDNIEMVKNRIAICELLLNKNANLLTEVSFTNNGRKYEGVLAAFGIHLELVKFMAKNGADIRATFDKNQNIVYNAISYMTPAHFHELCRFLIEDCRAGDLFTTRQTVWNTPILHKIIFHASSIWHHTIEMILNSVDKLNVNETNEDGDNLIGSAISGDCSLKIIKLLVRHGVKWNHNNNNGQSMLHLAAWRGNVEAIDYFISIGLSLKECDYDGNTPILSISKRLIKTVEYLVDKYGVNVQETDKYGDTIAHKACLRLNESDFNEFTNFLLKPGNGGGDIFKLKNNNGETLLHKRLTSDRTTHATTLKLILSTTLLNVNVEDKDENNLFLSACKRPQNVDVLKRLVDFGTDCMWCNKQGENALHLALSKVQLPILRLNRHLVDSLEFIFSLGVNPNHPDRNGVTPLDLARKIIPHCTTFNEFIARSKNIVDIFVKSTVEFFPQSSGDVNSF